MVLEESEPQETNDASVSSSDVSARVSFTTRRSAERAFSHGKSWQGHKLQFLWLTSINTSKEVDKSGNPPATSNASVNTGKEVDSHGNLPTSSGASDNTGKDGNSIGNLPAASNAPSDVDTQTSGDDASADNQRTPASEPGNHKVEADADSAAQEKDSKSTSPSPSPSSSGEKQL